MYKVRDIWDQLNCGDLVFVSESCNCDCQQPWALGFIHRMYKPSDLRYLRIYTEQTGLIDHDWFSAIKVTEEFGSRLYDLLSAERSQQKKSKRSSAG